jgi:cell division protein FtsQ
VAARRRTTARIGVLPAARSVPAIGRFLPSGKSVVVGLGLLAFAVGAYVTARDTSLFAVRTLDVRGGTPTLRAQVRAALAGDVGKSLLRIDQGGLVSALASLPAVRTFTFDRAFPHTLRVVVRRERPVLVVRRVPGKEAYLVAASGRVLRSLPHPERSSMPRLWVTHAVHIAVGGTLPPGEAAAATAAAVGRDVVLAGGIRTVRETSTELTLTLGSGLDVRLGDGGDLRLKLAIARRIIAGSGGGAIGAGYLDVSVPERPVLHLNSQVVG